MDGSPAPPRRSTRRSGPNFLARRTTTRGLRPTSFARCACRRQVWVVAVLPDENEVRRRHVERDERHPRPGTGTGLVATQNHLRGRVGVVGPELLSPLDRRRPPRGTSRARVVWLTGPFSIRDRVDVAVRAPEMALAHADPAVPRRSYRASAASLCGKTCSSILRTPTLRAQLSALLHQRSPIPRAAVAVRDHEPTSATCSLAGCCPGRWRGADDFAGRASATRHGAVFVPSIALR
jgi:hypothetical protein